MPLQAYKRRHSEDCLAELARRADAGEIDYPEDLEHYKRCNCAWWVRGTTDEGKLVPRHSLKVHTWEAATAALKQLNQPAAVTGKRILIETATEEWLAEAKMLGRAEPTLEAYDLAARILIDFMTAQRPAVRYVQDVTPSLLNLMRSKWELSPNTHNTYRTQISTFLNYCVRMDYLASNPMEKTRSIPQRRVLTEADRALLDEEADEDREGTEATMPLDLEGDANYKKVCASLIPFLRNEIVRPGQVRKRDRRGMLNRHPENCLSLCHVMYETGLRVSDATFFNPDKIEVDEHGGIYRTIQIKTKWPVTVFLEPWLVDEIRRLPRLFRRYPFYDGSRNWRRFINNNIRPILRDLGQAIGIEGSLRPHRFRDSFAVNRLNENMSLEELKVLIGHKNVAMTERYYAPFVKSRATSLRNRVRAAREGKLILMSQRAG
ncbi:MAG TPA: tyrosine-type recombinase/integrase [Candidatus Acidoferrales bacterium]|nr:tyrosine-type recombinase/integrase [Candidatus Acidoferrales bacterium]